MAIVDGNGLPLGLAIASASPAEVTLVHETLSSIASWRRPRRLIGDKAYDSDKLDRELARENIKLIAPNRSNRKIKTQDGRALRRYNRRWKVERLFAWLGSGFRRVVIRWERHSANYLGFLQCACALMLLRRF